MAELHLIAHNIRSTENVGSLFRTCDSLGISKLWLTGYSPGIDHPKVKKTALGAEKAVVFEKIVNIEVLLQKLKADGFRVVGLELDPRSLALEGYQTGSQKLALLLGNEVEGVSPYLREQCDDLVFIQQKGVKESLNVSVAAGIAAYSIMLKLKASK